MFKMGKDTEVTNTPIAQADIITIPKEFGGFKKGPTMAPTPRPNMKIMALMPIAIGRHDGGDNFVTKANANPRTVCTPTRRTTEPI